MSVGKLHRNRRGVVKVDDAAHSSAVDIVLIGALSLILEPWRIHLQSLHERSMYMRVENAQKTETYRKTDNLKCGTGIDL